MQSSEHIVVIDGSARIAGKERIRAETIARLVLAGTYTVAAVVYHFGLTEAQVHAAIAYTQAGRSPADAERVLSELREQVLRLRLLTTSGAQRG